MAFISHNTSQFTFYRAQGICQNWTAHHTKPKANSNLNLRSYWIISKVHLRIINKRQSLNYNHATRRTLGTKFRNTPLGETKMRASHWRWMYLVPPVNLDPGIPKDSLWQNGFIWKHTRSNQSNYEEGNIPKYQFITWVKKLPRI
jgi:hypothetical protein